MKTIPIKKILLIFLILSLSGLKLKGQEPLRHLGNGLPSKVYCGCTDSGGNVYAVTTNIIGDSLQVNKWNIGNKTWSVYAKMKGFINSYNYSTSCIFYNDKFYLTGAFNNNFINGFSYRFSGGTWQLIGTFKGAGQGNLNTFLFNNKLYFSGNIDTVNGTPRKGVAAYDGTSFSSVGFNFSNGTGLVGITNDTLLMAYGKQMLYHKAPNIWGVYYTNDDFFTGLVLANNMVYASDMGGSIHLLKGGTRVDSIATGKVDLKLKSFKNKVYLTHKKSNYNYGIRFGEVKNKKIAYYFHNALVDSSEFTFVSFLDQNLYYLNRGGIVVNDIDYHFISEINVDSLNELEVDTIVVRVFRDINRNYKFDGTDAGGRYTLYEDVSGDYYATDAQGFVSLYPLDNEDYNINYMYSWYNVDSCYNPSFTGSLKSGCYNSSKNRDSVYFPLWRKTTANRNLVLKSYSWSKARMMDTVPLNIYVYTKDCGSNISKATVKVTLDPNTTYISSSPTPASKIGNVLTYNFSNIVPYSYSGNNDIRINVVYPNSKYTIGQTVRHYARLTTTYAEDTMDNLDSIVKKIVYSYDPNVKHCIPEGKVTKDLNNIRYHIEFQNEGNDDAIRVTVVDTLNLTIPVYEFQMVGSSHPYKVSVTPGTNIVTWVFDNINLKPKSQNDAASKGYLIFDAKLKTNVRVGDSIRNKASIYFDYNKPIITNYAVINRVDPGGRIDPVHSRSGHTIKAYPNPAQQFISIENSLASIQKITVYDVKGARVTAFQLEGNEVKTLPTDSWAKGLYIMVNEKGEGLKIIIE